MLFHDKFQLRIPGPTPIPPQVQMALTQPMIGHRSTTASTLIETCSEGLKHIFGTQESPLILTSSGTAALEAAAINALMPGDEAIVIVTGAFGDRFAKILKRYQIKVHRLEIPWGHACDPHQIQTFLEAHPQASAVFMTYCETSTGVLNPISLLARTIRQQSDALIIVDAVSCLGAVPSLVDQWGIDIMVSGSQKALMLPPGLAFVTVSQRAWPIIEQNPTPRFYLDLHAYRKQLENQTTPYTPALNLLFGLEAALTQIETEGLPQVFTRHQTLKRMTRAGLEAIGFELMTSERDASPTVTSVSGHKQAIHTEQLRSLLKEMHVHVAGGQQHMKGKIFRIGHMGYCDGFDILTTLAAIEMALTKMGITIELGSSIRTAQEVWIHA
ncbi:alanine--glyoxylate aminotransferase family protein [Hazenella sp. IB182357]|uniref:Alanine--glyoxylate aminotransferase family protein n=1 Tax=Polycladospora coralii TaxID=2771432 RepID=A0A926RTR1_9BACL|nr:alanine--glyoxylate aminotransferase family protein [Polycladospora coralii]MBD1371657.1 alanine--glyoxylate aminotransferase family protein [Polycladospora coralii]